ncbi:MAG: hypothetical protein CVU29_11330 [Betaproteobacteria bacterium HGW-Betaproteobacteria-22]|nr:MAG: hypothetical protein CVU29_11330 [Betaproteobacteria bacterium HGW-Betaproteobacteria-22]
MFTANFFARAVPYDPKFFLRDGQSIAATKKLRLRTPRCRVGQVSYPLPPQKVVGATLFYLKRTFNIAAWWRPVFGG